MLLPNSNASKIFVVSNLSGWRNWGSFVVKWRKLVFCIPFELVLGWLWIWYGRALYPRSWVPWLITVRGDWIMPILLVSGSWDQAIEVSWFWKGPELSLLTGEESPITIKSKTYLKPKARFCFTIWICATLWSGFKNRVIVFESRCRRCRKVVCFLAQCTCRASVAATCIHQVSNLGFELTNPLSAVMVFVFELFDFLLNFLFFFPFRDSIFLPFSFSLCFS